MHLIVAFLPALLAQPDALLVHHHLIKQVAALPHLLAHVVVELVLELLLLALFNGSRLGWVINVFSSRVIQHTGPVVIVALCSNCSLRSSWPQVSGTIWEPQTVRHNAMNQLLRVISNRASKDRLAPLTVLRDSVQIQ